MSEVKPRNTCEAWKENRVIRRARAVGGVPGPPWRTQGISAAKRSDPNMSPPIAPAARAGGGGLAVNGPEATPQGAPEETGRKRAVFAGGSARAAPGGSI